MKIKSVETNDYSVALYTEKDYYYITWSRGDKEETSERFNDYKNTDFMFELKLSEVEGN